jgi:hypothetical protein
MKQKSCKGLSSKREQKLPGLLISKSTNQMIDVPSLNNSKFSDYVDRIYSIDLEIKDTTDVIFFIYLHLEIDNVGLERSITTK